MIYEKLFEPMKIGKLELKNRISMAPMGMSGLVTDQGGFNSRGVEYFVERARGGAGLLITGCAKVENEIEPFVMPSQPNPLFNPSHFRQGAMELTERVHAYDCRIFLQMTLGFGRVVHPGTVTALPVSPSPTPNFWDPSIQCRELSTEEVERLVESFARAARTARECGFDGVEVHAVHEGYLLDQFTLEIFNQRTDRYGGDLRGRLTLPVELLRRTKELAGEDYPVMLRYGVKSYMQGFHRGILPGEDAPEAGRDLEEGLEVARLLEEAGYDAFNADGGVYDSWYWAHPPMYLHEGTYLHLTERLKQVVSVPVLSAGKLGNPEVAERALREGRTDGVSLGRPLLADPHWPKKVRLGQAERIRPCIGCHEACLKRIARCNPLCCAVNPQAGREKEYGLVRTSTPRRILVVGGGPAGMEAARVAALRGHRVVLHEASDRLGGHVVEGSVPEFKDEDKRLLRWYEDELRRAEVEVRLNCSLDVPGVLAAGADAVVVATGSVPLRPRIEGFDVFSHQVVSIREAFLGLKPLGDSVLVLGAGLVGCELALWLVRRGKRVTLVERLPRPMMVGDVAYPNRTMLLELLAREGVEIRTSVEARALEARRLAVRNPEGREERIPGDTLILAAGYRSDNGLYRELLSRHPEVYRVGDAVEPRNIHHAVWTGYEVAREL